MFTRRALIASTLAMPSLLKAQETPSLIKIISGFAAGGTLDATARTVADYMSKALNKQVIVEAMAGAGGRLAGEFVQKAAPDGGTLLIGNIASLVLTPLTISATKYDVRKDFTPLSYLLDFQIALNTSKQSGITSLPALIAYIKANPDKASYAVPAAGSLPHLIGLEIEKMAGVKMQAVIYRGTAQIVNDLVGGHVGIGITGSTDVVSQSEANSLNVLAVTGLTRNDSLPKTPTFTEQGFKGFEKNGWQGLLAPQGLPANLTALYSKLARESMMSEEGKKRLSILGYQVIAKDGAALIQQADDDIKKYAPLIEQAGLKG